MSADYTTVHYDSLRDRSILITGGASGIGAELVAAFAAQGSRVSFLDIDSAAGMAVASQTSSRFISCDVTDIAGLRQAIRSVESAQGGIDVLVNNAGKDDRQVFSEVEPEAWRRMMSLNLEHQFFASQAVAASMGERGAGCIIMLGSVSWMRGRPGIVSYTTAKAAINGLTRTLSRELGPQGIRVNCIVPGAILTERQVELWLTPELNQQFIDLQALKFRLTSEHVARMALFLGSDESSGCTGANFMVDAGLTQN